MNYEIENRVFSCWCPFKGMEDLVDGLTEPPDGGTQCVCRRRRGVFFNFGLKGNKQ
jgi:hypothetical protein